MFTRILIITAFLSAQLPPSVFAQEQVPAEEEFKKGVEELRRQSEQEQQKVELARQTKELQQKQQQLRDEAKNDAIVLTARLNELEYLSDFLDVDAQAKQSVERALTDFENDASPPVDILAVATVVALGSGGVYILANQKKVVADKRPPGRVSANVTYYKPGLVAKALNSVRGEPALARVSGYATLGAALATAGLIAERLYRSNRLAGKVNNLQNIYLSRLASNGQLDYLNEADVAAALSEKSKDPNFGSLMITELGTILAETEAKAAAIETKRQEIAAIEEKIIQLNENKTAAN